LLVVILRFDFLFGLVLREVIEIFSPDHGFICVELEVVVGGDGINELLGFGDSKFLDLVAVQEQGQLDEMIPGFNAKKYLLEAISL
jgi:hypothetical protein